MVVSKNFRAKHQFRIRFATVKPCFALQFLPPTSGRNCAATQATPSEVLGWSRANSANAYWTLYTITLAHTILGIWYATLKKTQITTLKKIEQVWKDFVIFRPSGWDWVGADCNEFFQISVNKKQSAVR